ncbi:hypothetical protein KSP35_22250 [Aquihabitans sp. G128]|uniref:hypothetical protein n=1 Tax=Aquihabitans sp. G128 TaxID=2849779 RepID=UPI001C24B36D|nr:hypothetical protein [Aquihabitans sp. G128]QXC61001.1 hypothetical protein KSP35_22250 [Aquihabitans sp. G128]
MGKSCSSRLRDGLDHSEAATTIAATAATPRVRAASAGRGPAGRSDRWTSATTAAPMAVPARALTTNAQRKNPSRSGASLAGTWAPTTRPTAA